MRPRQQNDSCRIAFGVSGGGSACVLWVLLIVFGGVGTPARAENPPSLESASACFRNMLQPSVVGVKSGIPFRGFEFYRTAIFHLNSGDFEKAFKQFDHAIDVNPDNLSFYMGRGVAYECRHDPDRATADFDRAIELNPNPDNATEFEWRAFAYSRKRDYARALQDLSRAVALAPYNPGLLNNRCLARARTGALDEALADCNESLRIRPGNPATLTTRGLTHLKKGALDDAIADYDTALRNDPKQAYALYGRGIAKRLKGDAAGGVDDIAAALALEANVADEMERNGIKR